MGFSEREGVLEKNGVPALVSRRSMRVKSFLLWDMDLDLENKTRQVDDKYIRARVCGEIVTKDSIRIT